MPKKASNVHFAIAVQQLIDECYDGTMLRLSEHTGMSSSTLGYYVRAASSGRFPSVEALATLIKPLDEEWKRRLVTAFMRDHVPEGMEHLVKISGAKGETKPALVLAKDVEEVFEALRNAAAKDNNVKNWLLATGRAMLGK
jgi:hypothetical protein